MSDAVDTLPLLALGGGVAAAAALLARTHASVPPPEPSRPAPAWVFPVPIIDGRRATVSDGFESMRTAADGTKHKHLGADVMFKRRDTRDLIAVYAPKSPNGSTWFFMPDDVPVLAAAAGIVRLASSSPYGFTVIIQHDSEWTTYYTHLASLAVVAGTRVGAGQILGTIGSSPTDRERLKHLHFELWKGGRRTGAVDPAPYLAAWTYVAMPRASLRNAALVYRPVGDRGEPYPAWLRDLRESSGVYVIRERGGPVVYVGSSSAGRLYDTLTRHFQTWRRWKSFWKGQYAEGHDPGLTYHRASVEVAVRVTRSDQALDEESRLIARLRPRDNILGQPELEEAPF